MKKPLKKAKSAVSKIDAGKDVHLKFHYIMFIIISAVISYLALFLKFPNEWSVIVNVVLLVLLICNFKSKEGLLVVISAMILSILTLPITILSLPSSLTVGLMIFVINIVLMVLIIFGLKHLKMWGLYLTLAVFALSIISLVFTSLSYIQGFLPDLFYVSVLLRYLTMVLFYVLSGWFLLKHKGYFS